MEESPQNVLRSGGCRGGEGKPPCRASHGCYRSLLPGCLHLSVPPSWGRLRRPSAEPREDDSSHLWLGQLADAPPAFQLPTAGPQGITTRCSECALTTHNHARGRTLRDSVYVTERSYLEASIQTSQRASTINKIANVDKHVIDCGMPKACTCRLHHFHSLQHKSCE